MYVPITESFCTSSRLHLTIYAAVSICPFYQQIKRRHCRAVATHDSVSSAAPGLITKIPKQVT
jgi:hypothetical protein